MSVTTSDAGRPAGGNPAPEVRRSFGRPRMAPAGLAIAGLLVAGCSGIRRVEYRLPETAMVPFAAAGIVDRSAEYGSRFCSVLLHLGGEGGPWGGCGDYLEAPGPADPDLPPLPADYRILVIPGLLGQCLSPHFPAMGDALAHLREKHGLDGTALDVPALGSCELNGEVIAEHLRRSLAEDPRKFILVGYSKGACDSMSMLAAHRELRERVAALITVAAPVGGSRLPDVTPPSWLRSLEKHAPDRCDKGDAGGIASLGRPARQAFLRAHPAPLVPTYSLVAVSDETNTSRALEPLWDKLSKFSLDQDAQVIASEGVPPGARFLGVLRGDHWAVGVPFEQGESSFLRGLIDHNHFPRAALLEAALRVVIADLASGASPSSVPLESHRPSGQE